MKRRVLAGLFAVTYFVAGVIMIGRHDVTWADVQFALAWLNITAAAI